MMEGLRELIPKRDVNISVDQIIAGLSDPEDICEASKKSCYHSWNTRLWLPVSVEIC